MAQWLRQGSHGHECTVHDLEVMGSNSSQLELGVRRTSVQAIHEPKISTHDLPLRAKKP